MATSKFSTYMGELPWGKVASIFAFFGTLLGILVTLALMEERVIEAKQKVNEVQQKQLEIQATLITTAQELASTKYELMTKEHAIRSLEIKLSTIQKQLPNALNAKEELARTTGGFVVTVEKDGVVRYEKDLKIHVSDLKFIPDPQQWLVFGTVSYGTESRSVSLEENKPITFPEQDGYDIKVIRAGAVSTDILIVKHKS